MMVCLHTSASTRTISSTCSASAAKCPLSLSPQASQHAVQTGAKRVLLPLFAAVALSKSSTSLVGELADLGAKTAGSSRRGAENTARNIGQVPVDAEFLDFIRASAAAQFCHYTSAHHSTKSPARVFYRAARAL